MIKHTSHTEHPDILQFGLNDDCPRCARHADDPWASLDSQSLGMVYARVLGMMYARVLQGADARSLSEGAAMPFIQDTIKRYQRLQATLALGWGSEIPHGRLSGNGRCPICGHYGEDCNGA